MLPEPIQDLKHTRLRCPLQTRIIHILQTKPRRQTRHPFEIIIDTPRPGACDIHIVVKNGLEYSVQKGLIIILYGVSDTPSKSSRENTKLTALLRSQSTSSKLPHLPSKGSAKPNSLTTTSGTLGNKIVVMCFKNFLIPWGVLFSHEAPGSALGPMGKFLAVI